MSFEKIPALLEQLVSLVTETNKLLTEQKALLDTPLRQTHVIDASLSTLPTPTISAQTEGRPLTAAEAPAALHGIANVGNAHSPVENQPTQDAPAPAPAPADPPGSGPAQVPAGQAAAADMEGLPAAAGGSVPPPAAVEPAVSPAATGHALVNAEDWLDFVASSGLSGPARELAANCAFTGHGQGVLRLVLADGFDYLQTDRSLEQLGQALADHLGQRPRIVLGSGQTQAETLHARQEREREERQTAAQTAFSANPYVRELVEQQGARLVPDTIRPYQE